MNIQQTNKSTSLFIVAVNRRMTLEMIIAGVQDLSEIHLINDKTFGLGVTRFFLGPSDFNISKVAHTYISKFNGSVVR